MVVRHLRRTVGAHLPAQRICLTLRLSPRELGVERGDDERNARCSGRDHRAARFRPMASPTWSSSPPVHSTSPCSSGHGGSWRRRRRPAAAGRGGEIPDLHDVAQGELEQHGVRQRQIRRRGIGRVIASGGHPGPDGRVRRSRPRSDVRERGSSAPSCRMAGTEPRQDHRERHGDSADAVELPLARIRGSTPNSSAGSLTVTRLAMIVSLCVPRLRTADRGRAVPAGPSSCPDLELVAPLS